MFNKEKFASILSKINDTYSSMTEFAQKADFDRTYISKYINMKLDNPPTPKILEKISNASNGLITYKELMLMCNYIDDELDKISGDCINLFSNPYTTQLKCTVSEDYIYNVIYTFEILDSTNFDDKERKKIVASYNYIKNDKDYYKYIIKNEELKKQYFNRRNTQQIDIDEADIAFATGVKGLNETNKMIIKNTLEALLAKQEQDKKDTKE